jgi:hypothetical protein
LPNLLRTINKKFVHERLLFKDSRWILGILDFFMSDVGFEAIFEIVESDVNGKGIRFSYKGSDFYINDYDFQIKNDFFERRFEAPVHSLQKVRTFLQDKFA